MEPILGEEIGMSNLPRVWGYPSLADYLATKPEASIFSPFSALTIRDLLYRQAELKKLQDEHERLEWRDYQSQRNFNDGPCYAKNWEDLSASDGKGNSSEQWEHFQLIQRKLWAYREALIQASTIAGYPSPTAFDFDVIQRQLDVRCKKTSKLTLMGRDGSMWGSTIDPTGHALDVTSLRRRQNLNEDAFTRWTTGTLLPWFDKRWPRFRKNEPRYGGPGYVAEPFLNFSFCVSTVIASTLPITAISVLFYVNSMRGKLITIGVLNILYALCFNIFTNPRRSDVFIAVSTFAAVLAMFVNVNNSNNIVH